MYAALSSDFGYLPSGTAVAGEFRYAAELVRFIRETQGDDWHIEVAAYPEYHPEQRYAKRDLQHFADKVKAGANSAITQFFFNPDAYFHFVDEVRALGVDVPIVPGIMPIHNYARVAQFAFLQFAFPSPACCGVSHESQASRRRHGKRSGRQRDGRSGASVRRARGQKRAARRATRRRITRLDAFLDEPITA